MFLNIIITQACVLPSIIGWFNFKNFSTCCRENKVGGL